MRPTQHRAERDMQVAQTALKRNFVLAVLLGRRLSVGMPRGVRERALLREQQEEYANKLQNTLQSLTCYFSGKTVELAILIQIQAPGATAHPAQGKLPVLSKGSAFTRLGAAPVVLHIPPIPCRSTVPVLSYT